MNTFKRFWISPYIYVLIIFLGWLSTSHAEGLNERGAVKLATGKGYAPFVDDNLSAGGWSVDIVRHTFRQLSLDIQLDVLPWDRALKWTKDRKVLAAFPFVYSKPRAELFLFSEPINYVPIHMYVAKDSDFLSIEQLKGKRLCFPLNYTIGSVEQAIFDKFEMVINRAKDGFACVRHVNKGWSDAGITNGYINAARIKIVSDEKVDSIRIFDELLGNIPLYLVISKHHPQAQSWIDEFNHGLKLLESSGQKSIIDKQHLQNL